MAPSKIWMRLVDERLDDEYLEGVENFLDYAFSHAGSEKEIRCPCIKCCNTYSHPRALGFFSPESVWNSEKLYLLVPLVKLRGPLKQFLKVKAMKKCMQRVMMKPLKLNLTM